MKFSWIRDYRNEGEMSAERLLAELKKKNKYNARRVFYDGHWFDSIAEKERYKILKILNHFGKIRYLRLQHPFEFWVVNKRIFKYYADFTYYDSEGKFRVEDVKGKKTDVYKLKKKLIEAQHKINIQEIKAK